MQSKLILNVLAVALAASFAGSTVAQDLDTVPTPPADSINPTPPVNPEPARSPLQAEQARQRAQDAANPQVVDPRTGPPYTATDRMHDAKDGKGKDYADKDWSKLSAPAFVNKALKSGRMEVESARTAQQRATDPRVREFAETLERDHTQLNARLGALGLASANASANLDQGDRPVGMRAVPDVTHKNGKDRMHGKGKMDKLGDLQGAAFDRHYVAMQVKMHDKSIAMYQAASIKDDNPEVQALARDALPTLRAHAELARSLHVSLSAD